MDHKIFKLTFRMNEVSIISAINVDTPLFWQSPEPIRAKIESTILISALVAGTKQPI